jgi:hypothetical protein
MSTVADIHPIPTNQPPYAQLDNMEPESSGPNNGEDAGRHSGLKPPVPWRSLFSLYRLLGLRYTLLVGRERKRTTILEKQA